MEEKAKKEVEARAKADEQTGRGRIKAILECDEAKGREPMARHLALETDMSVEQSKQILSKTAKATRLDEAMASFKPGVTSHEENGNLPAVDLNPSAIYARRAEQYSKTSLK